MSRPRDDGEPSPSKNGRTALAVISVALVLVLSSVWALPYTSVRNWPVIVQLVALDKVIAATLVALAIVLATIGVLWRKHRGASLLLAVAVVATSGLFAARALAQGMSDGSNPSGTGSMAAVSWNADGVPTDEIAARLYPTIEEFNVQVVVLPESGWKTGDLVADSLSDLGYDGIAYAPQSTATSVILARSLATKGAYRVDDRTPPWAGLALLPAVPSAETPVIVATHLQQPSPGNVATWQMHLNWVARLCQESPYVIVLGDTNTTLNSLGNGAIGACRDVAAEHGSGAASTWPTWLPSWLGVSIDRFMLGEAYDPATATFRVLRDVPASETDHWPVLVSLRVAAIR